MSETKTIKEPVMDVNPEELSQEELNKRRLEITNFYKDNIKHLKVQLEYETMLSEIEKKRAERVQAQMFMAQIMAKQQGPPTENTSPASEEFMNMQRMAQEMEAPNPDAVKDRPTRTLKRDQ